MPLTRMVAGSWSRSGSAVGRFSHAEAKPSPLVPECVILPHFESKWGKFRNCQSKSRIAASPLLRRAAIPQHKSAVRRVQGMGTDLAVHDEIN
jgi:hypothetical protein